LEYNFGNVSEKPISYHRTETPNSFYRRKNRTVNKKWVGSWKVILIRPKVERSAPIDQEREVTIKTEYGTIVLRGDAASRQKILHDLSDNPSS
jgi:hypothetical protein